MTQIKISKAEYEKMQRQIAKLEALEAGGVDSWEWYSESLKNWFAENELIELMDDTIDGINDVLIDAEVDYPAGREAGPSIHFDDEVMKAVLGRFLEGALEIEREKAAA